MNAQNDILLPAGAVAWLPPQLSIIVPTFNERDNVGLLYDNLAKVFGDTPFEMIVVDDNSPDGTAAAVKALSRVHPNVRCLQRIGRRGLASACIEGISASAAPFFAVMDADHQHDEKILPQMLAKAMSGDDIVVATRYAEGGSAGDGFSASRQAGSQLATRLSNTLTGVKLSDAFICLRSRSGSSRSSKKMSRNSSCVRANWKASSARRAGSSFAAASRFHTMRGC